MRDESAIGRLASDLLEARDAGKLTTLPSLHETGFDLKAGYKVGRALHKCLVKQGFRAVGRKIGFTNPDTWREFNLNTPIWAHMYVQTVHFAEQGRFRLPIRGMVAPRIEPEIVLKLNRSVASEEILSEAIAENLEWVAIGFEIVDSHFPDWRFTAADAVADFGVHAAMVVGKPFKVEHVDKQLVATELRKLKVFLRHGTEVVAEGVGRNALGSPLLALGHLARVLATQPWAPALARGEIITTGSLTPLPFVHTGESWSVEVAGGAFASQLVLDLMD